MEYQAFVSLVPWTVIIQASNLLILTAILRRLLFRPVQNIIGRRRAEVDEIYREAKEKEAEAQKMHKLYGQKLRNASKETEKLKKQAENEMERMKAEALERARSEAAYIRETAKHRTEQERKKAAMQLRAEVADIAIEMAEKILRREINSNDQRELIEEFMDRAEFGR